MKGFLRFGRALPALAAVLLAGAAEAAAAQTGLFSLDTTFGPNGTGLVSTDLGSLNDSSITLAGATADELYSLGQACTDTPANCQNYNAAAGSVTNIVTRYSSSGIFDATFGTGGLLALSAPSVPFANGGQGASAVDADDVNQRIYLGGSVCNTTGCSVEVARFKFDGTLDTSYGARGLVTVIHTVNNNPQIDKIYEQADGKLLVLVDDQASDNKGNTTAQDSFLARVTADGTALDSGFGNSGTRLLPFGGCGRADQFEISFGTEVYVSGRSQSSCGGAATAEVARVNLADGSLDATFGENGSVTGNFGQTGNLQGFAAAEETAGGEIAYAFGSGGGNNGTIDAFVVVLHNSGAQDTTFAPQTATFTPANGFQGVSGSHFQTTGELVFAGSYITPIQPTGAANGSNYNLALVRVEGGAAFAPALFTRNARTYPVTPNSFLFQDQADVPVATAEKSNTITVSGIPALAGTAPISISGGGQYSINGGAFTSAAGTVANGSTVQVQLTSSANLSTSVTATLTIGTVSAGFSLTTGGPPPAPANLTAAAKATSVSLSWGAVGGARYYKVYQGTTAGGESTTAIETPSGTTALVNGLNPGGTYYFIVKAGNFSGLSAPSNEVKVITQAVPAAPVGLTATVKGSSAVLSWGAVAGATGYKVYEGTTRGGESSTAIASPTGSAATIGGLTPGATYYFTVKAGNAAGLSAASNEAQAAVSATPPPPSNLAALARPTSVLLSWTGSAGATTYKIYQGTTAGGEAAKAIEFTAGTSAAVSGLTAGSAYFFVVKAGNAAGLSGPSNEVQVATTVAPSAPTGLTATAKGDVVLLSWTASAGAASYKVYRGTSPGGESNVAIESPGGTVATVSGLLGGTTYYFTVKASNTAGLSAASNEARVTTPVILAAPTGLTGTPKGTAVSLSWTGSAGATGYLVYQNTIAGAAGGTVVGSPTGTAAAIGGLIPGTTYYFSVKAQNASGLSLASSSLAVTIVALPAAPSGLAAGAVSTNKVSLSWTGSAGASNYKVYVGTTAGGESTTAASSPTGTAAVVSGLTAGTTYFFIVKAQNITGLSPASNEVQVTTP